MYSRKLSLPHFIRVQGYMFASVMRTGYSFKNVFNMFCMQKISKDKKILKMVLKIFYLWS